jgi:hypothetical protein
MNSVCFQTQMTRKPKKLVILSIDSGLDFRPIPAAHVLVRARLEEAWLESGEVAATTTPHFGTELAWEVEEEQLRELRRKRAGVRVEVWRGQEMIGHQVFDISTAVHVDNSQMANTSLQKLKGCSLPSLRLGLGLAIVEETVFAPVLVEGEGKEGYFELGPTELCTHR